MRRHGKLQWIIVVLTLLAAAWPARSVVSATAPRAGSTHWTGTFTFTMSENYKSAPGPNSSHTIIANCTATVTRHADLTASASATYSYHEEWTSGSKTDDNESITILDVPTTNGSFPQYLSVPSFTLNGDGTYSVYAAPPAVTYMESETIQDPGSNPTTQTMQGSAGCDPAGGEQATAKLQEGTTQTGSAPPNKLLNGTTVTMEWTIQDPTLAPISSSPSPTTPKKGDKFPTGKITVTNKGIDASLSWKGWEIGYSGDWKVTQTKSSAPPTMASPDGKVQITIQQPPSVPATAPTATAPTGPARATIKQIGQSVGPIKSISFKPFTIGTLTGQIGIISLSNSSTSLLVAVVGGGTNQIVTQTLIKSGSSPLDLVEAGIAIGSLHQTS